MDLPRVQPRFLAQKDPVVLVGEHVDAESLRQDGLDVGRDVAATSQVGRDRALEKN